MKLKGIIDYDCTNYKKPCLTLEFPHCSFKCDELNGIQCCQNGQLAREPDIEVSFESIWELYQSNPLTKAFCCQGLEPFDSLNDLWELIDYIRNSKHCTDEFIIYTGYNRDECSYALELLNGYPNIAIKWGRYLINNAPHYDDTLGIYLASDNQYAEWVS